MDRMTRINVHADVWGAGGSERPGRTTCSKPFRRRLQTAVIGAQRNAGEEDGSGQVVETQCVKHNEGGSRRPRAQRCALHTPQLLSPATMIACADNNARIRDYCHRGSEACELARNEPILPSCVLRRASAR